MVARFSQRARLTAASRTLWSWPAWRPGPAIEVLVDVVDFELQVDEVGQGMRKTGGGEVVAHLASFPRRPDQSTAPQTGRIRHKQC